MEQIEPVASQLSYMVAPGNHESADNFSHFTHRFEMPMKNESSNLYYSFDGAPHSHCIPRDSFSHTNLKSPCVEQA